MNEGLSTVWKSSLSTVRAQQLLRLNSWIAGSKPSSRIVDDDVDFQAVHDAALSTGFHANLEPSPSGPATTPAPRQN